MSVVKIHPVLAARKRSDAQLVEDFLKGQKSFAFDQLVKRYQDRIYWTVLRIVKDHEDASDVVQEAFVTAWRKMDKLREAGHFYTWMYRIAVNAALGHLRKEKKQSIKSSLDNIVIPFQDEEARSDKGLLADEKRQAVADAIKTLPRQQKRVFEMRFYDEMKYDEIAALLGRSTGTLKANYHHAVRKMEEELRAEFAVN